MLSPSGQRGELAIMAERSTKIELAKLERKRPAARNHASELHEVCDGQPLAKATEVREFHLKEFQGRRTSFIRTSHLGVVQQHAP